MSLIIDTCSFSPVFSQKDPLYDQFEPVRNWFNNRGAKIVYGGSTYKSELKAAHHYHGIFLELRRSGIAIEVNGSLVDEAEKYVKSKESDPDFDDPHLIAIGIVSRCRVLCTKDKRCHKFVKKKTLYPKGTHNLSIYSCIASSNILNPSNIIPVHNSVS